MNKALKILVSILLPPLGVACQVGLTNFHFWLNILLTLLGWLPGLLHALILIMNDSDGS